MFYQVRIAPARGVAGRWDVWRDPVAWADDLDLLRALYTNPTYDAVYDFAQDALPAYVDDIRGRVYHEPARILALVRSTGSQWCSMWGLSATTSKAFPRRLSPR